MGKLKKFVKSRTTAQFLLLSAMLVELVFVILYPSFFSGNFQMSWAVFALALANFLIGSVLLMLPCFCPGSEKRIAPVTPFILFGLTLLTFFLFVPVCYGLTSLWNLMDVLAQVIVCAFLLLTSSVLTTIAVFKRQVKEQQ